MNSKKCVGCNGKIQSGKKGKLDIKRKNKRLRAGSQDHCEAFFFIVVVGGPFSI